MKVESVNCFLIQKSNRGHILINPAARRNPHQQPSGVFEFLPQAFSRSSEGKDFAEFAGPRGLQRPAHTCAFALKSASDILEQVYFFDLFLNRGQLRLAPRLQPQAVSDHPCIKPGDRHIDHCGHQRHRLAGWSRFQQTAEIAHQRQIVPRGFRLAEQQMTLRPSRECL